MGTIERVSFPTRSSDSSCTDSKCHGLVMGFRVPALAVHFLSQAELCPQAEKSGVFESSRPAPSGLFCTESALCKCSISPFMESPIEVVSRTVHDMREAWSCVHP